MHQKNLGFRWSIFLGLFGFLAGYVGPIILAPDANQGPLLGLLITGPLGFVAGLALWMLATVLKWSPSTQRKVLYGGCLVLLLSVLVVLMQPKPRWLGRIYQVEIVDCSPPSAHLEETLSEWRRKTREITWLPARPGWEEDLTRILRGDRGALVVTKILSEKVVKKEGESKVSVYPLTWAKTQQISFYIAEPCANLPTGLQGSYFVSSEGVQIMPAQDRPWPPQRPSDLLIKATLEPVPDFLTGY